MRVNILRPPSERRCVQSPLDAEEADAARDEGKMRRKSDLRNRDSENDASRKLQWTKINVHSYILCATVLVANSVFRFEKDTTCCGTQENRK